MFPFLYNLNFDMSFMYLYVNFSVLISLINTLFHFGIAWQRMHNCTVYGVRQRHLCWGKTQNLQFVVKYEESCYLICSLQKKILIIAVYRKNNYKIIYFMCFLLVNNKVCVRAACTPTILGYSQWGIVMPFSLLHIHF